MRKVTRPANIRQKRSIFSARGSHLFSTAFIRALPKLSKGQARGAFALGAHRFSCALGRSGLGPKQREGDGRTPLGQFRVLAWLKRPDHWRRARSDARLLIATDGWCDDPRSPAYNRPVRLPFAASAESLWREDGLYDLIGVVDYNWRPRVVGRGSAIFIHLARPDHHPTEGCVALDRDTLRRAQFFWSRRLQLVIGGGAIRARPPKIAEPTRT